MCVCGKCQLNLNQKSLSEWMDEESVSKNLYKIVVYVEQNDICVKESPQNEDSLCLLLFVSWQIFRAYIWVF